MEKVEAVIEKKLKETAEKLEEICQTFSKKKTSVKEKVSISEKTIDTTVIYFLKVHGGKRPEPVRIVPEGTDRFNWPRSQYHHELRSFWDYVHIIGNDGVAVCVSTGLHGLVTSKVKF